MVLEGEGKVPFDVFRDAKSLDLVVLEYYRPYPIPAVSVQCYN